MRVCVCVYMLNIMRHNIGLTVSYDYDNYINFVCI